MAETLIISSTNSKTSRYETLIPQIEALVQGENDVIANLSNIAAAIRQTFGFLLGRILYRKNNELVLGPFQGPIACTRIGFGKGVCGSSWKERKQSLFRMWMNSQVTLPAVQIRNQKLYCQLSRMVKLLLFLTLTATL